jgi:hypothetical protein
MRTLTGFWLGTGVGVAAGVAIALLVPALPLACPAISHIDDAPIAVHVDYDGEPLDELQACLNEDCVPQPVEATKSNWVFVPQETPYLAEFGTVESVTIQTVLDSGEIATRTTPILKVGPEGTCSQPFRYESVAVSFQ